LISAPSGIVTAGTPAATVFAVRVLQSDGVTPVAGAAVTFSIASGTAQLGACGAANCIELTDSSGVASAPVTPLSAGTISLSASMPGASQTATFNAALRTLTAVRPMQYLAAGNVVTLLSQMLATQNSAPAAGVPISWASTGALTFSPAVSNTDANGVAQSVVTAGPLNPGSTVVAQACAWTAVCAGLTFTAIDPSAWRVV